MEGQTACDSRFRVRFGRARSTPAWTVYPQYLPRPPARVAETMGQLRKYRGGAANRCFGPFWAVYLMP